MSGTTSATWRTSTGEGAVRQDVVLDVLLERQPHAPVAAGLLALLDRGELEGVICPTTVAESSAPWEPRASRPPAGHDLGAHRLPHASEARGVAGVEGGDLRGPDQGGCRQPCSGEVGEGKVLWPSAIVGAGDHHDPQEPKGAVSVAGRGDLCRADSAKQIGLEAVVVAPEGNVGGVAEVAPVLEDLGDDQGLEEWASQGVQRQGGGVADAKQPGGEPAVDEVELRCLDEALAEVAVVGRQEVDQIAGLSTPSQARAVPCAMPASPSALRFSS